MIYEYISSTIVLVSISIHIEFHISEIRYQLLKPQTLESLKYGFISELKLKVLPNIVIGEFKPAYWRNPEASPVWGVLYLAQFGEPWNPANG